jgi:putative PEP-CTERM system TPR-repeat lipoprotein
MTTIQRHLLATLLATAGLLAACSGDNPETLLASAKQYMAAKDPKAAQIQLKNALQKVPESAEARYLLGKVFLDLGDPVSATVELEKARALNHPAAQVVPPLAFAMVGQGQRKKAIEQFGATTLGDAAADADLQTTLAIAHALQGDSAQANAALTKALRFAPDHAPALLFQARLKAGSGDLDGATALVDQVLAKNPKNDDALVLRGNLVMGKNPADREPAARLYRDALAANERNLTAHSSLLLMLLNQNELDAAQKQLDELKKVAAGHPQAMYYEAQLALQRGDLDKAKAIGEQLLRGAPDDVRTLQLLGSIELRKGSLVIAEERLSRALQNSPGTPSLRRLLAQTYLQLRQGDKAYATIAPLAEHPEAAADVLSIAAQAQLLRGDTAKAEALFERAVKKDPTDNRSRTALALTDVQKGRTEQGLDELAEIAAKDSGTTADIALIATQIRRRDLDGALKAIDALEKKPGNQATASTLRGRILIARGDRAGAAKQFERALAADRDHFPAIAGLASLDLGANQSDAAAKRVQDLLTRQPQNEQALLTLAYLKLRANAPHDEVTALINTAIKNNGNSQAARLALIEHHVRRKDYKAALEAAQAGVAAMPENFTLLEALGRVYLATNDQNQAIATFNKMVALQPKAPQPLLRLADAQIAIKANDAAIQSLQRALALQPDLLAAQRGLIALELAAKRPKEAIAVAREVQKQRADNAIGHALEGDIEAYQRNWPAAIAAYRAGITKQGGDFLAPKVHAAMVAAGGSRAAADQWAAEWIRSHPKDTHFLGYLGESALAQRDWAQAEARYQAVLKLQPDNVAALNNLAWASLQQDKPTALAFAQKANTLAPEQPALMDTLALALAKDKQYDKAVELQKKAVGMQPQNHGLRLTLAKVLLQSGDKAAAKAELETLAKVGEGFRDRAEVDQLLKTF